MSRRCPASFPTQFTTAVFGFTDALDILSKYSALYAANDTMHGSIFAVSCLRVERRLCS